MTKLLERYGEAVGLEIAPEAIEFARKRGVKNLIQGSITDPPFAAGSFDLVLSLDVIEHVDNDVQIIDSLFEIVKPGGHLIVTVPAFKSLWSQHDEINHHKRRYRVKEVEQMLTSSGFTITQATYCNSLLFPVVFAMRKGKTWVRRIRGNSGDDNPESDLAHYPKLINEALYRIVTTETDLLKRFHPPFGVSILAVAQRPLESTIGDNPASVTIDALIASAEPQKVFAAQ
jgi:SAM-dependent methyltransferase